MNKFYISRTNSVKTLILFAMLTLASVQASADNKIHEEKFPNYFNTAFTTVINTVFGSGSGTWSAWSNSVNSTVVVVDYAQYSAPCAVKIVNYNNNLGLTTASARSTSPTIPLLGYAPSTKLELQFYVFSYEAISSANTDIGIQFYNGASNTWVDVWRLTGQQFNTQVGLNNWKKYTLNIPNAYRRNDFKYRIEGNMKPGVNGNQYIYFDDFSIATNMSLLPTDVEVSARAQGSNNLVSWTNFNEGGNRDYTIERSADGRNFSTIGSVAPQTGSGLKTYSFTDRLPLSGVNYYRIAINTLGGEKVYTTIKVVAQNTKETNASLFPNPVADFANISIPTAWQQSPVLLQIVGVDGRVVKSEQRQQAAATEWIGLQRLNPGAYRMVVRSTATGETQSISFIKK